MDAHEGANEGKRWRMLFIMFTCQRERFLCMLLLLLLLLLSHQLTNNARRHLCNAVFPCVSLHHLRHICVRHFNGNSGSTSAGHGPRPRVVQTSRLTLNLHETIRKLKTTEKESIIKGNTSYHAYVALPRTAPNVAFHDGVSRQLSKSPIGVGRRGEGAGSFKANNWLNLRWGNCCNLLTFCIVNCLHNVAFSLPSFAVELCHFARQV